jgi:hypothetical protein
MIACMRHTDTASPLKLYCVHYFVVPELKAVAQGTYMTTADLTQRKHIEAEFRNRAFRSSCRRITCSPSVSHADG